MVAIFVFGNTPKLSLAELQAVITAETGSFPLVGQTPTTALVELPETVSWQKLFPQLGGSMKIARLVGEGKSPDDLANLIRYQLVTGSQFGVSVYDTANINISDLCLRIKRQMEKDGIKSRYVLPRQGRSLSAVAVAQRKLREWLIVPRTRGGYFLGETLAVFDFSDWSKRDFGRPAASPHQGMLPPRVARMMVNLGLPSGQQKPVVLDPFCGVGTILAEALLSGCQVGGLDSDPRQIEKARRNLAWLQQSYNLDNQNVVLQTGNARKTSRSFPGLVIDAIVTEPDLGPPMTRPLSRPEAEKIAADLEDLYLASLADWRKLLGEKSKVVIALPSFLVRESLSKTWLSRQLMKNVIDKAKPLGYSVGVEPIEYARPKAIIHRNICVLWPI